MLPKKKKHPKEKAGLHLRSKHRQRYDLAQLVKTLPALAPFVAPNKFGDDSIDFFDPSAVKALNTAILKHHYGIEQWNIPDGYLCPPVPGRADYIHHAADLLRDSMPAQEDSRVPTGQGIRCLDIGMSASCIYPIIGAVEYGWSFVGSDIDPVAVEAAQQIVAANPPLKGKIEIRLQPNAFVVFDAIIKKGEHFDLTICNPPFHASPDEAREATERKLRNLKGKKAVQTVRNFAGRSNELWCDGGEKKFVNNMIAQSKKYRDACFWFTTLISKQTNMKGAYKSLKQIGAAEVKTIPMGHGNKTSRMIAWTFLSKRERLDWMSNRWKEVR